MTNTGGAEVFDTIRSNQDANAKVQLARPRAGKLTVTARGRIVWLGPLFTTVGRTGRHALVGCHSCTRVLREKLGVLSRSIRVVV